MKLIRKAKNYFEQDTMLEAEAGDFLPRHITIKFNDKYFIYEVVNVFSQEELQRA